MGRLDGTWRSRGYGWIVEIDDGAARWFDDSPRGLIPIGPPLAVDPLGGLALADDRLTGVEPCGLTPVEFQRIPARPPMLPEALAADPVTTFDVLWETVRDHHAFLSARGVDWEAVGDRERHRAARAASDRELFGALRSAVAALHDDHVGVEAPFDRPSPTPGLAEVRAWIASMAIRDPMSFGGGQLVAGRLDPAIGYLGVLRMGRFAGDPDADACLEVAAARGAIDEALGALHGVTSLVVDLRGNTGGWDVVALALAAPFVDARRTVFTKAARDGSGTTSPRPVILEPAASRRFGGPIAVLVGGFTASAAEVFLLALRDRSATVLVGGRTRGITSDELEKRLPNGWTFTLSNEVYRTPDGWCPEVDGFRPTVEVAGADGPTANSLQRGLSAAVAALGRRDDPWLTHRPPP